MPQSDEIPRAIDVNRARALFDPHWYRRTYPDIGDSDPWEHYLAHGDFDRRSPGPGFNAEFYASTYLALEERHPFHHYCTQGLQDGLLPAPLRRTAIESRNVMAAALEGLEHPFVLLGNDAQRAGGPLLLLEVARHLRQRGWSPVFLLNRGGPLLPQFRTIGPTILIAEGHDVAGLGEALSPDTPLLANTAWTAPVLTRLEAPGPALLAVHEMPDYLRAHGLLDAVAEAELVVTAMPAVTEALLRELPEGSAVRTVFPGLLHTASGPGSVTRVAGLISAEFGADRIIFLGAGFADTRKGFDRFLESAQQIRQLEPRSAFVWLGDLGSWGQRQAARARESGLPLMLPGFRLDASAWYANCAVYLLTSRQDPGPTTVMDASRQGVPFIAAPGDLGPRSVEDRLTGVSWFLDDLAELPVRALELARSETAQSRAERAERVETLAPFGRYVDDLLALLELGRWATIQEQSVT